MNLRCPHRRIPLLLSLLLAACATPQNKPPGDTHLAQAAAPLPDTGIPTPVQPSLAVPKPTGSAKTETYSVVVNNVRVHDLLFALARDAKVNVDVHPGLQGNVTLNAIDQTLPQILDRLARQADLRWELDGQNLSVMPDTPYLQTYRVDYVNMKRDTTGAIQVSGEISGGVGGAGTAASGSNGSSTKIDNTAKNHFWETLTQNIKDILHETDKVLPEGSSDTVAEQASQNASSLLTANPAYQGGKAGSAQAPSALAGNTTTVVKRATFREAAAVIANPETGVLTVRATARQQEKIQQFLDQVLSSAKRQVLIEATIVEVELSNQYQQGVDWSRVASSATRNGLYFSQAGAPIDSTTTAIGSASGLFTLTARGGGNDSGSFNSAIRLLESFGNVKVLSSPKISAINNQSAILKVVDNRVYFNVKAETTAIATTTGAGGTATPVTNYTTELRVVPVGFVLNVTPQISEQNEILLNVRPSITRIVGTVRDPNPSLTLIENEIPIIRTREMESVLRLQDGSIAVMGGLMEEEVVSQDSGVPWFHSIPVLGALFAQKNRQAKKTELVIFLRPTVIREPSMGSDYARLRQHLPSAKFFEDMPGPRYQILPAFPGPGGDKK